MTEIELQIAAIREAMASGAKRIVFTSGGTRREIEYQSLKDMREHLAWLEGQLPGASKVRLVLAAR